MKKSDKKMMVEMHDIEEDMRELSDEQLSRDITDIRYSSEDIPNDVFRYRRMRLVPNAEANFRGLIDKDFVLANVKDKKPDPDYLRFLSETIVAMDVFSVPVERKRYIKNIDGGIVPEVVVEYVPDRSFDIVRDFLRASLKSEVVLSRAMGRDREAVLDRSQFVGKEFKKSRVEER